MTVRSEPHKEIVGGGADAKYIKGACPAPAACAHCCCWTRPARFNTAPQCREHRSSAPPRPLAGCTELYLARRGIEELHGFERFTSLESLWLPDNSLRAISGLDANLCIRELHVPGNCLTTLAGSIPSLRFLTTLDAARNSLSGVGHIAACLARLRNLLHLNLAGNPCCQEAGFRRCLAAALPSLVTINLSSITDAERRPVQACPIPASCESCLALRAWRDLEIYR